MKEIACKPCGKALGFIEKARIMKGIAFLCPDCAAKPTPEALRQAADAFAKNRRPSQPDDFMDVLKKMAGL